MQGLNLVVWQLFQMSGYPYSVGGFPTWRARDVTASATRVDEKLGFGVPHLVLVNF